MKIFNSIKWRLQIWYGLILVAVLAGLGIAAYELERGKTYRQVDGEMMRGVNSIANALHDTPPHPPNGDPRFDRPGEFPEDRPPEELSGENFRLLHLRDQTLFIGNDTNSFYFVVWKRDGSELVHSTNAPTKLPQPEHQPSPEPQPPRMRGMFREISIVTPPGEMILVGCSIASEVKELRLTALKLAGFGGIILFFGLAGGWWFVSRALRPIENISAAAVKISAGDLSQRINVAEAESELGQLAAVLNSTFARLEAAFAQQQQFTSDAAHELRTPVSVMLTQTQTALNREREAADYKQTVEACQRAAQRMRRLIESLLALARLDAGQEQMKRLDFDLSNTVSDCVELIRPLADGRGVKISAELQPLEISGDSERLAQVVMNLLTNAIQYNLPDGEARVKLESQNGMAVLTVSDTGAGISAEDLPRVFERFYRVDKSRSTGGNGLGLAIAKAIVEAHGGTIEVSSEENVGTTFTVRLPAA
jgi:heavy metal sensor kinase